jgi:hypothetical protein
MGVLMDIERIENSRGPFSLARIQDAITVLDHFQSAGISPDELREYLSQKTAEIAEAKNRQNERQRFWEKIAPRCPDCGSVMFLQPLSKNYDGIHKTRIVCSKCPLALLSEDDIGVWMKNIQEQNKDEFDRETKRIKKGKQTRTRRSKKNQPNHRNTLSRMRQS